MTEQETFARIANALEQISQHLSHLKEGRDAPPLSIDGADAFLWDASTQCLRAVTKVNRVPLTLIKGVDDARDRLLANSEQFAKGLGANNVLLWGAKGMGKSSLVKAVHADISARHNGAHRLVLIEIEREDIGSLPALLRQLSALPAQFILFCDDLSFSAEEASYKSLKSALDGGLEGRPDNVIFYATSNRRHLLPRDMIDNERATAVNPGEAIDEKVSLSDRFGLWLGFHNCDQETYLDIVSGYAAHFGIPVLADDLARGVIAWAQLRGARSGRVAMQFIRHIAGENGIPV